MLKYSRLGVTQLGCIIIFIIYGTKKKRKRTTTGSYKLPSVGNIFVLLCVASVAKVPTGFHSIRGRLDHAFIPYRIA